GRGGILANKREGDGGTPRGRFRLVRLWWRAGRVRGPAALLPSRPIPAGGCWGEGPAGRRYNRGIPGPRRGHPWRQDAPYDLIIEIDPNPRPRVAGRGSAVFIHVARPGFSPTAGCVALEKGRLRLLLTRLGPRTVVDIR